MASQHKQMMKTLVWKPAGKGQDSSSFAVGVLPQAVGQPVLEDPVLQLALIDAVSKLVIQYHARGPIQWVVKDLRQL